MYCDNNQYGTLELAAAVAVIVFLLCKWARKLPKLLLPMQDINLINGSLGSAPQMASLSVQPFFAGFTNMINKHTDHATSPVARVHVMRPKNVREFQPLQK